VVSTAIVVAGSSWASMATGRNFSYLVIVPVMVSAVWLGQRHTALLVGGLALSLAFATGRGVGPFAATESLFDPLLAAQLFMSVVQLTALVVGVEASRRRDVIAELDAILAATLEGVLVVDDTGTVRHTNAGAESILAASPGGLIGLELSSLVSLEGVEDDESLHLTRALRVDGSEFWAEVSLGKIFERSGRRRTAVVVRDVTSRIETEESVRRIQDEFVSNMTHELKTPLTAIIGFSDWMLSDPDTPNSAEDLEMIRDSALSMKSLIDDILDFKRISGAVAASDPVDLGTIVKASVNVVSPVAKDRSIEISVEVERCPAVLGDADQLQSAVQNLMSNAVKYSNSGGRVRVGMRQEGGQVHLKVEDEGIGIPAADQGNLFVRFFRAGNTGDIHGTGLGLALVRQVVEQHGGSVDIVSSVGEGTTVTLRLPVISPAPRTEAPMPEMATMVTEPAI
jgi:PAS domain S-box-containing protein